MEKLAESKILTTTEMKLFACQNAEKLLNL